MKSRSNIFAWLLPSRVIRLKVSQLGRPKRRLHVNAMKYSAIAI